ncbi:MAG TPA: DNA mismatch repair endonuclease MutL [Polyangia bacterium]|nr:DNA mismatch repair endonuclease MutL [Polyangia bacterium]
MDAPRIRILPPELADQIAAGEVVERPASVVKELAENALDAGARRIEIEVEGGGLERIAVSDDGAGMTPDEAHLALKRHATSKLAAIDDLYRLSTMGFRGEALPSIAAVSELALTTRHASEPRDDGAGYRLEVKGGVAGEARAVSAPIGTTVEVRRLLQNVPARLKFLKSEPTEAAHVADAVVRLALAHPHVHFKLRTQGRLAIDLPPHVTGLERARAAVARSSRSSTSGARLHLAVGEEAGVHVEAYLGSPAESTTTSRATYPFVNRRFVRDRGLLQAVVMGYGELLERGRYPLAVVHVTVPGDGVDVNVHPQKLEVRFARPQEVYAAVRHAIAQAVARAPWLAEPAGAAMTVYSLPPLPRKFQGAGEPEVGYADHRRRAAEALKLFAPSPELPFSPPPPVPRYLTEREAREEPPTPEPERFFSSLQYLGQLDRTYLVCEAAGELVLIDQHAAHERVAFQRLREAHAKRQVRTQRLLLPASVELDEGLRAVAGEHAELLAALGFELEPGAGATPSLMVRALPEAVASGSPAEVLTEVLGELATRAATSVVSDQLDHVLATMACHSVVRAGDLLSEREVKALFAQMDGIDYRAHCPHGRPVLLRLSVGELERRFGRT